jgi:hypothetical protein
MPCQIDTDCANWTTACDYSGIIEICVAELPHNSICENIPIHNFHTGRCVLNSIDQAEDDFLNCYIDRMGSSLEDYLRRTVLPSSLSNYSKYSTEFVNALKLAASEDDCVSEYNALDISRRSRYVYDGSSDQCKAEVLGLTLPEDYAKLNAECPSKYCLGTSCRQVKKNF